MKHLTTIKKQTLTIAAALLGCSLLTMTSMPPSYADDSAAATSQALPDLSTYQVAGDWNTKDGTTMTLADLRGSNVVISMGYANCHGICPRLVSDMRRIEQDLTEEQQKQTKLVFVTIDPDVDTPPMLAHFAHSNELNPDNWVLLQGTHELTRELAAVLSVSYKKIDDNDYSHSSIISVLDKEGVLVAQQEGLVTKNSIVVEALNKLFKS